MRHIAAGDDLGKHLAQTGQMNGNVSTVFGFHNKTTWLKL